MTLPQSKSMIDLPEDIQKEYYYLQVLSDGRICGIHRLMYHWTLHVDIDDIGYADRYCYPTYESALVGLIDWDGVGDPKGWHRHVGTGRRRNLQTGEEWIAD